MTTKKVGPRDQLFNTMFPGFRDRPPTRNQRQKFLSN